MKLSTHIAILFTLFTAVVLVTFSSIVYYSAHINREREFYSVLKKEALTKANLFFDAQVEPHTLQMIYRANREILNEVEVAIYTPDFELLYHDAVDIDYVKETESMIEEINKKGYQSFYQDKWQVVGMRYAYGNQSFVVTAAAFDEYGYTKLNNRLFNMIFVFCPSMFLVYFGGLWFAKNAFSPIREITEKARTISATNLDLRITHQNNNDELSELASTFNQMLDRLEASFESQKEFVSNISHELRTPLAAVIGELELAQSKERGPQEFKQIVENALGDAKKMARLADSLLNLAKASYHASGITFKPSRIDEIVLEARETVLQANPHFLIDIRFEGDFDDEENITLTVNTYLMKVAFVNLIENGCKFSSNNKCMMTLKSDKDALHIEFEDRGTGISQKDLKQLFTPFFRGENRVKAPGNGVGLYLSKKIVALHGGELSVRSTLGKGSVFVIILSKNKGQRSVLR